MNKKVIGILAVSCLAIAAGHIYNVGRTLELEGSTSLSFDMQEGFKSILLYASMAPSGHNAQPWKVRYNEDTESFTLFFDDSRSLPQVDEQNREAFISLGAFLENWKQAARSYGYEASITIFPELGKNMEVAQISMEPAEQLLPDAKQRLVRLLRRHTDKRSYEAHSIPASAINKIIGNHQSYLYFYPKGTPEYAWISTNAIEARSAQAHHEGKRLELADWMRFSNAEARQYKDGLPAEQLGLTGLLKAVFYTFYSRKTASTKSFALQAVKQAEQQVNSAAGFFVVTGSVDFKGTVQAGMRFEEFWLDAVELGISIHPMSQILEEKPFANNIKHALSLDAPIQMIVRAGINNDYGQNNRIRRNINLFTFQTE